MTKNEAASVAQGLDREAVFAAMYARDPYWDTQGRSSAAAVRLALDVLAQAAPPAAVTRCNHDMRWTGDGTPARCQHCGKTATEIESAPPAAPATGESGAESFKRYAALEEAGKQAHEEMGKFEAYVGRIRCACCGDWTPVTEEGVDHICGKCDATPPAAEAASQPGEMGAEVPESTNQGEQKCQSKLNVMLLRSVAPVTQDNTSLGDVSRSTSIGAANSMVGSAIRTGDGEAQNYRTADGMPTERAVLEREWRKMRDQLAALPAASAQQDEPMEWRIEVGGPSGYVRFETFQGVTLDDALDSAVAQNFYPAQDEDGWTRIEVKV